MATAELVDAVKALSLDNPDMGVKKIAAAVKAQGLTAGAKEVRTALAEIKAASSPAVSPSKSPVKAESDAAEAAAPVESARQQKVRERREAADAAAKESKARKKRKQNAFAKLFPELDVQAAFAKGVDRRVQAKAKAEIQTKLTDQSYMTSAMLDGRLSPQDLQELMEDMKAGGFTPSMPDSDDEDSEEEEEEEEEGEEQEPAGAAGGLGLPSFGGQADVSAATGLSLPSFGDQKA